MFFLITSLLFRSASVIGESSFLVDKVFELAFNNDELLELSNQPRRFKYIQIKIQKIHESQMQDNGLSRSQSNDFKTII